LLARDAAYDYLNRVLAVEVTSRVLGIRREVALGPREGLPPRCVANLDNLRAVPKSALQQRAGRLSARQGRGREARSDMRSAGQSSRRHEANSAPRRRPYSPG